MSAVKNVTRYAQLGENLAAIEKLAESMLQAKFFGLSNKGAAFVVATELFVTGESPMEYQRRNGFVSGNPYVPYDAMIAAFQEAGGVFHMIEKTANRAAIELVYAGRKSEWSLTWDEAQNETFPYAGKTESVLEQLNGDRTKLKLKAKYATPRSRAIMLFARLADDAIRSVASSVNFGRHTSEIVEDFEPIAAETSQPTTSSTSQPTIQQLLESQQAVSQTVAGQVTSSEVTGTQSQATSQQAPPSQANPEQQQASQVTQQVAQEPPATVDPSQSPSPNLELGEGPTSANVNRLMDESMRETILQLIAGLEQTGMAGLGSRVGQKLREEGFNGLLSLTIKQGEELIESLKSKEIEVWINAKLPTPTEAEVKN